MAPFHAMTPMDGVQARVVTGRRTAIELQSDDGLVSGRVTTVDDGKGVTIGGRVILSYESAQTKGREGHQTANVLGDGTFVGQVPATWSHIHATYLPLRAGHAESNATLSR